MTTLLPAAPTLPGPSLPVTRADNPLLDWLGLTDSDGGVIAHYRLMLEPGTFDILHRIVYAGGADFFYSLGYLLGSSYATALMRLILDPNRWLTPLTNFYNGITRHLYAVVPPTVIMVATFVVLLLSVFVIRSGTPAAGVPPHARAPGAAPPGLLEQWLPSNTQIAKAQWQRLGSGLVMMGVVWVLATNPFAIIREIVDAVLASANMLSFTGDSGGNEHVITGATSDMIRSVTFLVNYRQFLSPDCAHQWSLAINNGAANPRCLTASQLAATDPDLWTLAIAVAAVFIAWAFLSFSLVVAMEFFKHLTLSVGYFIGATWIAALTLANRRPYDPLAAAAARGAVHGTLAIAVLFIASAGPSLFLQLVTSVLSFLPTLIKVLLAAAGYYLSGKAILFVLEKKTSLLALFKSKIQKSQTWLNLYPPNAPATVMSTAMGGALDQPGSWAKRQYQQIRTSSTAALDNARKSASEWLRNQDGADTVATAIIDDTPEFQAATEKPKLYDKPTTRVTITGEPRPATDSTPAGPIAAADLDGTIRPALPAPAQNPPPDAHTVQPLLPHVWFRGGLPQFAPPPDQFSPPAALVAADPPAPQTPADTNPAPSTTVSTAPEYSMARLVEAARAEAARLHNVDLSATSIDEIITRTTQAYLGYDGPRSDEETPDLAAAEPDLRSVLTAAQWIQRFNHHRNLLLARGIEAIPTLPEDEEELDRIVFAADSTGQIRIETKNDRGFGDWV
ncbi:MAG: hypothetical protein PHQ28_01380 [Mycobacterium sp.]|nr:hypothetical protein [Mycobacterium sp.]